jgi:segregation and condensation protein A
MMASEFGCEQVIDHLMFHKALIDDGPQENREARIESYMRTVEEIQKGTLVPSEDPFERSVSMVFELVVQQRFDPWDINLIEFSKLYLSRIRKADEVNLIIAGKIVYMAWEILRLQSEQALKRAETPETVEVMFDGWDPEGFDQFVDPFELGQGEALLYAEEMPIDEKVRRKPDRPVTLIDLLDAFDEAKKESDIRKELARFMQKYKRPDFDDKAHKESLEDDIAEVWERLQRCGSGPIAISDLYASGKEDRVTVFVAALFLAKMGKISLWQEKVPFGAIFVEAKVPWDIAQLEDANALATANIQNIPVVK